MTQEGLERLLVFVDARLTKIGNVVDKLLEAIERSPGIDEPLRIAVANCQQELWSAKNLKP